ncbi:unnamed protein product [Closterium sp. Yama58-4]|nr:unnamed protein product [Closterium sp. Yama58-4]
MRGVGRRGSITNPFRSPLPRLRFPNTPLPPHQVPSTLPEAPSVPFAMLFYVRHSFLTIASSHHVLPCVSPPHLSPPRLSVPRLPSPPLPSPPLRSPSPLPASPLTRPPLFARSSRPPLFPSPPPRVRRGGRRSREPADWLNKLLVLLWPNVLHPRTLAATQAAMQVSWHAMQVSWLAMQVSWHAMQVSWHAMQVSWHAMQYTLPHTCTALPLVVVHVPPRAVFTSPSSSLLCPCVRRPHQQSIMDRDVPPHVQSVEILEMDFGDAAPQVGPLGLFCGGALLWSFVRPPAVSFSLALHHHTNADAALFLIAGFDEWLTRVFSSYIATHAVDPVKQLLPLTFPPPSLSPPLRPSSSPLPSPPLWAATSRSPSSPRPISSPSNSSHPNPSLSNSLPLPSLPPPPISHPPLSQIRIRLSPPSWLSSPAPTPSLPFTPPPLFPPPHLIPSLLASSSPSSSSVPALPPAPPAFTGRSIRVTVVEGRRVWESRDGRATGVGMGGKGAGGGVPGIVVEVEYGKQRVRTRAIPDANPVWGDALQLREVAGAAPLLHVRCLAFSSLAPWSPIALGHASFFLHPAALQGDAGLWLPMGGAGGSGDVHLMLALEPPHAQGPGAGATAAVGGGGGGEGVAVDGGAGVDGSASTGKRPSSVLKALSRKDRAVSSRRLQVTVVGVRGLASHPAVVAAKGKAPDTYATVRYGATKRRTKVVHRSLAPEWQALFDLPDTGEELEVTVKEPHGLALALSTALPLGSCRVDYSGLRPGSSQEL